MILKIRYVFFVDLELSDRYIVCIFKTFDLFRKIYSFEVNSRFEISIRP